MPGLAVSAEFVAMLEQIILQVCNYQLHHFGSYFIQFNQGLHLLMEKLGVIK
jgi:hypothetical protein